MIEIDAEFEKLLDPYQLALYGALGIVTVLTLLWCWMWLEGDDDAD